LHDGPSLPARCQDSTYCGEPDIWGCSPWVCRAEGCVQECAQVSCDALGYPQGQFECTTDLVCVRKP
jgi:hypothetical protein